MENMDKTNEVNKTVNTRSFETKSVFKGCEYTVVAFFKKDARETAEQKLTRLIKSAVADELHRDKNLQCAAF